MRLQLPLAALALSLAVGACNQDDLTNANTPVDQPQQAQVGQFTQGNLIAALNNVNVEINRLLTDFVITDVRVVNIVVENVLNNARVLNNSHFLNNIAILQGFLNGTLNNNNVDFLNNALNNNEVAVAIDVLSGGSVILFTQPKP